MSRKRKNREEPESSQEKKSIVDVLIRIWVSQVLEKILASGDEGEIVLEFPWIIFVSIIRFMRKIRYRMQLFLKKNSLYGGFSSSECFSFRCWLDCFIWIVFSLHVGYLVLYTFESQIFLASSYFLRAVRHRKPSKYYYIACGICLCILLLLACIHNLLYIIIITTIIFAVYSFENKLSGEERCEVFGFCQKMGFIYTLSWWVLSRANIDSLINFRIISTCLKQIVVKEMCFFSFTICFLISNLLFV